MKILKKKIPYKKYDLKTEGWNQAELFWCLTTVVKKMFFNFLTLDQIYAFLSKFGMTLIFKVTKYISKRGEFRRITHEACQLMIHVPQ